MSKVYINPSIDQWKDLTEQLDATFIAYDDLNNRICNSQFYIKYAVTYDNSVPNLNEGTEIYSNKDGIIILNLPKERCRISLAIYTVSNYDESLKPDYKLNDYNEDIIFDNEILPFQPYIVSFQALYISDQQIPVTYKVPRKYVQVTITKSDHSLSKFTIESKVRKDYKLYPEYVNYINEVPINVYYEDTILDKTWECVIIVVGKPKELRIEAIYLGETRDIGSLISKDEIFVNLILFDGEKEITTSINNNLWNFAVFPQITESNLGFFIIEYNNLQTEINVPHRRAPSGYVLEVWYEGEEIKLGNSFTPYDLRIYLYDNVGLRHDINFSKCGIEPNNYQIDKEGNNWFTITYKVGNHLLKDKFVVKGYKGKKPQQIDFQMLYLDPNIHSIIDVTSQFDEVCKRYNERYFNWQVIFNYIISINKYGFYKLIAPELTGLSTRYVTEWGLHCYYNKAFSAELLKTII